jgi:hypothetical protein
MVDGYLDGKDLVGCSVQIEDNDFPGEICEAKVNDNL